MNRYSVKMLLDIVKVLHVKLSHTKHQIILSSLIRNLIPPHACVLDVGCGDGYIDKQIVSERKDIEIIGIDIVKRYKTFMPVTVFNGRCIPYADNTFNCVLLIDVLHHAENPDMILQEAKRVSKKYIIIKDHYARTKLDHYILKFMDWVGNRPHEVNLTYNFLSEVIWKEKWETYGLKIVSHLTELHLYPYPFTILFDGSKQFIVKLKKSG